MKRLTLVLIFCLLLPFPQICYAQTNYDIICKGIDVSSYQGLINWEDVKQDGISFAFIRCKSAITGIDPYFDFNASQAVSANIPIGIYYYSGATTNLEALEEVQYMISCAKRHQILLPLVYDIEGPVMASVSSNQLKQNINIFCKEVVKAGYKPMIYSNAEFFSKYLLPLKCNLWVACYRDSLSYNIPNTKYWQASSKGKVRGIEGNVDINYRIKPKEKIYGEH